MKKIALITDSTASLSPAQIARYGITTVPLAVIWGAETFEDGVTISPAEFYVKLQGAKVMPSTSQPSVGKFQQAFENLLAQDCDILGVFISSKLSGTLDSATQARELLTSGKEKIHLFDSETTTVAMNLQLMAVARAAEAGASTAECLRVAEAARAQSGVYFVLDTLEFLHRGGRIGGAARFLGTALNMKPILRMHEGKIEAQERIRTKGKALDRLIELVSEQVSGKSSIRLVAAHSNTEAEALAVLRRASAQLSPVETFHADLSPVIGTHTGPGTVALSYLYGLD
ncbi:MAG: DegV family protein [Anaerolineales bacterium]